MLTARLAALESNERNKLLKRAAQLRKASQSKQTALSGSRSRSGWTEDGEAPVRLRKTPGLEEYVWRILQQEEPSSAGSSQETGNRGLVLGVAKGLCEVLIGDTTAACLLGSDLAATQQSDLAVGDEVFLDRRDGTWIVVGVAPRRTKLSRRDVGNAHRERVIVANVDLVAVVVSVVSPPLHPRIIDRYLIAIQKGGCQAAVVVNKIDLLPPEERDLELRKLDPYRRLGVPVVPCAASAGEGIAELATLLDGKLSAFVGHSGVGKSSLVNALAPHLEAKVGEVSEGYGRGTHTTTSSSLLDLGNGIRLIDTPGIRSFGLWQLTGEELPWYFPEFQEAGRCAFADCSHTHEPRCAIKAAVEQGRLSAERYDTYLRLLEDFS